MNIANKAIKADKVNIVFGDRKYSVPVSSLCSNIDIGNLIWEFPSLRRNFMTIVGKISSIEGDKAKVVFEDRKNTVSPLLELCSHIAIEDLAPGRKAVVAFPGIFLKDGIIIGIIK